MSHTITKQICTLIENPYLKKNFRPSGTKSSNKNSKYDIPVCSFPYNLIASSTEMFLCNTVILKA